MQYSAPKDSDEDVDIASILIQYGADLSVYYWGRSFVEQEVFLQRDSHLLRMIVSASLTVAVPKIPSDVSEEMMEASDAHEKLRWLKSLAVSPRTLQHCCRYTIRTVLTPRGLNRVKYLPIPIKLKDYLLLKCEFG